MKLQARNKPDRKFETVSFRCHEDLAAYLKTLAVALNTSVSDVLIQLIEQYKGGQRDTKGESE